MKRQIPRTLTIIAAFGLIWAGTTGANGASEEKKSKLPAAVSLFNGDDLGKWKPIAFDGAADVHVSFDGALTLENGTPMTGVVWTGDPAELPRTNYEISLEAKRHYGDDFFCGLTFPVGQSHASLICGGWGGVVVGISSIDEEDASENETSQDMIFERNRWYKIRVRVTDDHLMGWIDGKELFRVELKGKTIGLRPGMIEKCVPLGIANFLTRSAFRKIELRRLDAPAAAGASTTASKPSLREIIVSHTDENGILQLYRVREDGSSRRKLTNSKHGCRMPACSPDGEKIVYTQQSEKGMALWLADIDGKDSKALTEPGRNLVPSWMPDSKHIVWMASKGGEDPSRHSQLRLMNTETLESRRLFSDPEQIVFSNSMPVVSPDGERVAFVSNRSGAMRIWVSDLDGGRGKLISPPEMEYNESIKAPVEQKVPAWSPDGKWIAHWEGVEMIHMSKFTGIQDHERDKRIAATFHVWVVGSDGKNRRKAGRGDDPTWSPDGFVTRAFPDRERGGPKVMVETDSGWKELPIVPPGSGFGRFTWKP